MAYTLGHVHESIATAPQALLVQINHSDDNPLGGGHPRRTVSVRYQRVAVRAAEVPDRLVGWLIRRQLETGARQLVHGLARAAARAR